MTARTASAAWLAVIALLACAGAAGASEPDDPHVELRTWAGLPASSAEGEVRLYVNGVLGGGGRSSLVARREGAGRWVVSSVSTMPRAPGGGLSQKRWRLPRKAGLALEAALDDPATFAPSRPPPETETCLDPWFEVLEARWRGRREVLNQQCGSWGGLARLDELLREGGR